MSYIGYPYVTDQAYNLEFEGQYVKIPNGTTAQRSTIPTAEAGMFRFNTDESSFEGYDGTEWGSIGGSFQSSYTLADSSTVQTIYLSALPFYLSNGNFSPICLKAGVVPFLLADGLTEIEYKVN